MNLLELAPIMAALPRPRFNPDAAGAARHVVTVYDESGVPVGETVRLIPAAFKITAGDAPRLVFTVHAGFETVEVTVADALHFLNEATGIDVARLLQSLGVLAA